MLKAKSYALNALIVIILFHKINHVWIPLIVLIGNSVILHINLAIIHVELIIKIF